MSNTLIELLILIVPFASVAVLSYLWYRVLNGSSKGDLATCANCGYAVRGLQGLDCPECGADLREVGIVTSKQRGLVTPMMFVLLWTLLLPWPSGAVSILLSRIGPTITVTSEYANLTPIMSRQYISVRIGASKNLTSVGTYDTALHIVGTASQEQWVSIDPVAMTYDYWRVTSISSSPGTTKPLNRQAVLDGLRLAGADITRQDVMDEAEEIVTIIQGIPTHGLENLKSKYFVAPYFNTKIYKRPAQWFKVVLLEFWVIVWILGFWLYFRIRRKRQPTQPESTEQVSASQPAD